MAPIHEMILFTISAYVFCLGKVGHDPSLRVFLTNFQLILLDHQVVVEHVE
jgi:hypothetical protein